MNRRQVVQLAGAVGIASLSGCVGVAAERDEHDEDQHTFSDINQVGVSTIIGDISVQTDEASSIELTARTAAANEDDLESIDLIIEEEGDAVSIEVDNEAVGDGLFGIRLRPEPKIDIDLTVPTDCQITHLDTTVGTIDVADSTGPTSVDSTTGTVTLAMSPST